MKHIGLFEGIGGFSLSAQLVGWETIAWCEWDAFCQTVLKYHFPHATPHSDIRTTDFTDTTEKLTFSQEGSHASHTAPPESGRVQMMSATCGLKCVEQFGKFPRVGSWAKMLAASLVGMEGWSSSRCKLTWKLKGTKYKRLYFQLAVSMPRTNEIEFGLLHTPRCTMIEEAPEKFQKRMGDRSANCFPNLAVQMKHLQLLPTPTAQDAGNSSLPASLAGRDSVPGAVIRAMRHTPQAADGFKSTANQNQDSLHKTFQTGGNSQLNPRFVAEMMGFPPNWLELPFQNTVENP